MPFIVLEGIEGCGKSTQHRLLVDRLRALACEPDRPSWAPQSPADVVAEVEPTKSYLGMTIRAMLSGRQPVGAEFPYLFAADRAWHLDKVILPALKAGKWVVLDRYILSSIAYQGAVAYPLNIHFPLPDLTMVLVVDPSECMRRLRNRPGNASIFEEDSKLPGLHEQYLRIARHPHYSGSVTYIGADAPESVVKRAVFDCVADHIVKRAASDHAKDHRNVTYE